jgi:hypothetical protein
MALESTKPLTEINTGNRPGGKGRPAREANNITAICEPIIYKMQYVVTHFIVLFSFKCPLKQTYMSKDMWCLSTVGRTRFSTYTAAFGIN